MSAARLIINIQSRTFWFIFVEFFPDTDVNRIM